MPSVRLKLTYTPTAVKKRPASAAFESASAAHTPTSASQQTKKTRVSIPSCVDPVTKDPIKTKQFRRIVEVFEAFEQAGGIDIVELTNIINIAIEKLVGKDADRYAVIPAEDWYDVTAQHGSKTEKRIHGVKV